MSLHDVAEVNVISGTEDCHSQRQRLTRFVSWWACI